MATATEWPAAELAYMGNLFRTTLNGAIVTTPAANTVETWAWNDVAPSGSPQVFNAQIGTEIVEITSWSSGNYTLKRGQYGTVPVTHLNGAAVYTDLAIAAGMVGSDVNISIDLGGGRVAWFPEDMDWATGSGGRRAGPFPRSAVIIQTGYDMSTAAFTTYLGGTDDPTHPANFFQDQSDPDGCPRVMWPGFGTMLDSNLGLSFVCGTGPFGAEDDMRNMWCVVDNPASTPDQWLVNFFPMWNEDSPRGPLFGWCGCTDGGDGWVYFLGTDGHPTTFMARFVRSALKQGLAMNPQWWCGPAQGFRYLSARQLHQLKRPVFQAGHDNFLMRQNSLHKRAGDGKWMIVGCNDNTVQYSIGAAGSPGQVFPDMTDLYTPPDLGQGLNYMAIAHPEQTWSGKAANDCLITYTPGFPRSFSMPRAYNPPMLQSSGL
jgi:hypothetical protein